MRMSETCHNKQENISVVISVPLTLAVRFYSAILQKFLSTFLVSSDANCVTLSILFLNGKSHPAFVQDLLSFFVTFTPDTFLPLTECFLH
jgi:Na+-translocating ferredoxin:NAD+ oxidoreductase RnfA subunit